MGHLTYGMHVSLDGYVQTPDGGIAWSEPSAALHEWHTARQRHTALDVCGRRLWGMMRYWQDPPTADLASPQIREFAQAWQDTDMVVVSRSLSPRDVADAPRTQLWPELDPDRLRDVVRAADGEVSISGPTLAAAALRAGLVDRICAWVMPHVLGGGLRFLPDGLRCRLELIEERRFPGGEVALTYDVVTEAHGRQEDAP